MTENIYNQDDELDIAALIKYKEEKRLIKKGKSLETANEKSQVEYDKARKNHALEFLKTLEKKLEELSNQDIANILSALLASGLVIEDEEELEYWIKLLEQIALSRVFSYMEMRDEITNTGLLTKIPLYKKRFAAKSNPYSSKELKSLDSMVNSIEIILQKRILETKGTDEQKKFLEREKNIKTAKTAIKQDLKEKKLVEEKEKLRQKKLGKNNNKTKKEDTNEQDYLNQLKEKMIGANVEVNGAYWNSVISDFDASINKPEFVKSWKSDSSQIKESVKIKELRGIENSDTIIEKEQKMSDSRSSNEQQGKSNSMNYSSVNTQSNSGR